MIMDLVNLRLTYAFLLFIIFIFEPAFFIVGLQISILRLQSFALGLQLSCALTIMDIHNFFKSKTIPELEIYSDVNNAIIVTAYDDPVKCVTVIMHPAFKSESPLIVAEYDNEISARAGHEKWIKTFEKWLPKELKDVTNNTIYKREYFE